MTSKETLRTVIENSVGELVIVIDLDSELTTATTAGFIKLVTSDFFVYQVGEVNRSCNFASVLSQRSIVTIPALSKVYQHEAHQEVLRRSDEILALAIDPTNMQALIALYTTIGLISFFKDVPARSVDGSFYTRG